MNILEYEAKGLLADNQVPVPAGKVVRSVAEAVSDSFPAVLKVQIPKGGRGKAGGIKIVHDQSECSRMAGELLGSTILDCTVSALWLEPAVSAVHEYYIALVVDRSNACLTLLAHRLGGVEIEQAAREDDPLLHIPLKQIAAEPHRADAALHAASGQLQAYWQLPRDAARQVPALLSGLYKTAVQSDALLVEINPLMLTADSRLVCADAKIELDNAAQFRHPDWHFTQPPASSQFVLLNPAGTVASMANGAGLAMATVDAIKVAGAEPANFFDVGGGTNVDGMVQAFQKIGGMAQVQAIVVNIFGGITRCDEVAQAIVEARRRLRNLPQLYIRLTGTNEAEGTRILADAGLPLYPTLAACVAEAVR